MKIKEIWKNLDAPHKDMAVNAIKEAFGLKSSVGIKQSWFYSDSIPPDKEARTFLILRSTLKKQIKSLNKLIDETK